ncbi:hypothetical protein HYFRA_00000201 [Hymenoscyphus fraxineus]|uniref:Uncharacterized protein n=1 Tax=Hymenoscyphus fraxineus TaxID=746836 RepID=A0A9N9PSC4_9HELO|nr:hypothetical protein HYFRA_00000201 [Hymenoscyphus fraxineus]
MPSTEKYGQPILARRNTFQRMLDLERKQKVNRLQAQPPPLLPQPRTNTMSMDLSMETNLSSYQSNHSKPIPQLSNHNRTMTAPNLSIAVPSPEVSPAMVKEGNGMKKYVVKAGGVVPQTEGESGDESDRSSICHSPGWDDILGNKKKKEKLEKQAAKDAAKIKKKADKQRLEADKKTETELKYAQKMKNRLSKAHKAPPSRYHNIPAMDRAASIPADQSSMPDTSTKDDGRNNASRSRRGSIDLSFKNFLHGGRKSNDNSASPQSTPAKEAPPGHVNNGFIGGLKLRLSEEASTQDRIRLSLAHDRPQITTANSSSSNRGVSPNAPLINRQRPTATYSMYVEPSRTPAQWDDVRGNAGKFTEVNMNSSMQDDGSIDQRKINTSKARAPMFEQMPAGQNRPSSRHDASNPSKNRYPPSSRSRTSGEINNYPRSSSPNSMERSSLKSRDRSSEPRGRDTSSYVQNQRRQSKDRAMATIKDDHRFKISTESASRDSSPSYHSVKSQVSNEATVQPATQHIAMQAKVSEFENPFSFFSDYTPPKLELEDHSPSRSPAPEMKHTSMPSPSRIASPSANSFVSSIFDTVENPAYAKRKPPTPVTDTFAGRSSKVNKFLGEDFPPELAKRFPAHASSNPTAESDRSGSHARTATDSSEEYSTLDEFSNVTTPMASRPQSQKDYFPPTSSLGPRPANVFANGPGSSTTSLPHKTQKPTMMSGAIMDDSVSYHSQDNFSRTAVPMEYVDDEERTQTPTGLRSLTRSTDAPNLAHGIEKPKESKSASALQRQLSLNRSASTPELQDLSFLPPLKHQALTKPAPKKAKGGLLKSLKGKESASPRDPVTRELIKPAPISTGPQKADQGPLESPSGNYLQNARLSLPPRLQGSPRSPRFPGSPSSQLGHPNAMPEQMAKMFVVCCSCKYFHDMPSKIYECMAKPDNVVEDKHLGVSGVISTSVKCPWCGHGMSTTCCAGYAAVVYLREKLH